MPITQADLEVLEDAMGTGAASGQSAPHGHNVQGALNVCTRIGQDMAEYGLSLSDLPEPKAQEYREAVADLRHYREVLARAFGDELQGELDGIELPSGDVMDFPDPDKR